MENFGDEYEEVFEDEEEEFYGDIENDWEEDESGSGLDYYYPEDSMEDFSEEE